MSYRLFFFFIIWLALMVVAGFNNFMRLLFCLLSFTSILFIVLILLPVLLVYDTLPFLDAFEYFDLLDALPFLYF
jgi:hypothetical protein